MKPLLSLGNLLKTVLTAGAIALAVWLSGVAHAAPQAGTLISNQASATYSDPLSGVVSTTVSNTVQAIVQQVAAFALTAAQTKNATIGSIVYLQHAVTNSGNGTDSFTLAVSDVFAGGFNLANLNLYVDANGDGVPDNLTPITATGALAPGEVFRFVAAAQVPADATVGTQDQLTVTAAGTATASPAPAQRNVDTVTAALQSGPDLVLQKGHIGSFTVNNNGLYALTVRNLGSQPTSNTVTVTDTLPPGLAFVPTLSGGTSWNCAATGQVVTCNSPAIVPAQAGTTPGMHPNSLSIAVKPDGALLTTLPVTLTNNAVVAGGGEPAANASNNSAADATVIQPSSSVSGRVWRDIDHNGLYSAATEAAYVLPGWLVELCTANATVCDANTRLGYAVTASDGTYVFKDMPAGNYEIQFRDPSNNIISGTPVNGDSGVPQAGSTVDPNRRYLFVNLTPGQNLTQQGLPLDPSGVIYNSITRQPVAGATVVLSGPPGFDPTVHLLGGAANVSQVTGPTGMYQYILLAGFPTGMYALTVTPPAGYQAAPSALFPPQPGPLAPPTGCTFPSPQFCSVDATNSVIAPANPALPNYYMSLLLAPGNPAVVNNHIPIDPIGATASSGLLVSKTSTKQVAEIGDFVDYTVKIQNASVAAFPGVVLRDTLPAGFSYVAGSGRLNGVVIDTAAPGLTAAFNIGALASNTTATLTYRLRLLPGAQLGHGINRAQASSGTVQSNVAAVKVKVQGGVFSEKAYTIGKVFLDCNLNGVQDGGEVGVPGVRLFLEDGTNITTDGDGKYSLYGLTPRTHVLKVDKSTLPEGAQLVIISNRQSGDAGSRFLDLKNGELQKADFALVCSPEMLESVARRREAAAKFSVETERVLKERLRLDAAPVITSDVRGLPATGMVGVPSNTAAPGAAPLSGTPAGAISGPFEPLTPGPLHHKNSNLPAGPASAHAAVPLDTLITELDNTLGFIGLKDGDTLPYAQTAVRVKALLGAVFKLSVNDVEVGAARVGTKLTLEDKQIQIWEYIGINLKAGENTLTVVQTDPFGNVRATQTIKLIAPADLGKIMIDAPREAPADGRGMFKVRVRLTDDKGVPVTVRTALTLESTRARWQVDDINKTEPGTQVFIEGGSIEFTVLAPHEAGEDTLRVSSGILKTEHKISFLPDLRPMIAAGVIEGAINFRSLNLRNLVTPRQRDSFEQEIQRFSYTSDDGKTTAAARAALFLKGQVKGDYLLTLAYDSDKNLRDRLFRDIQPDEFYPIYGDSSTRGFDAQSTQRLYVRVDKGRSFVLYGDFMTSQPSEARKLADYSRSLTGIKNHYENNNLVINTFASQDTFRQLVEEFPANGTSGPFQLNNRSGVTNGEKIEVLTRDRHQPAIILKSELQTRFSDYEIESFTGRILFKGPIASLDENLNPKSLRVTYEIDQGGEKFWIGGFNAQYKLFSNVEVGASYVNDKNPQVPYKLGGVNSTIKLGDKTFLTGEVAHSDSLSGAGNARRIELRHDDTKLNVRLSAGKADLSFDNPTSQLSKGRTEITGRASYKLAPGTTISAEVLQTADAVTQGRREGALVKVEQVLAGGVKVEAGVRHSSETIAPAQPTSVVPGAPATAPSDVTSARLKLSSPMPYAPQATMFAEYEQSLSEADKKVAALGGDYLLPGRGKLYVRHEFISSLSSPFALNPAQRNNVTVFGLDTDYAKDKHVFTEYRMRDAIDGRTAEAALGLRSGYQIAEGLKLTTSSERVHTLSGPIANESQAYTVGLEYTANPRLKASTRIEWRQSTQANSILGSVGVAYKLSDDWTTLARGVHSVIENKGAAIGERIQTRLQAGLAYRDSATDVWNALGRVEYRNEEDTTQPDTPLRRELALGSLHFNYQPAKSTLINGRVATKFVTENSLGLLSRSQTQLLSGRVTVDLNHDWDVGAQASILASRGFSDRQFGVGVEAGYQVADNLWLSAGYNVFGFKEKDLTSDPMDRGFFVRLRFKFDEDVFKPAKEKRPSVYATSKQSRPATVASPQLLIDPAEGLANETKGLQTSSRLQSVEYMTANETRLDYRISEPAVTRWLALVGYVSSVPGGGIIQQEVVMGPGSDEPQYTCVLDAPLHVFAVTDSLSRELTRATASGGSVSAPDGGAGK